MLNRMILGMRRGSAEVAPAPEGVSDVDPTLAEKAAAAAAAKAAKKKKVKSNGRKWNAADDLTDEQIASFYHAFQLFDEDGSGSITVDELGDVMQQLGQKATKSELNAMVAEVDADGSGSIEFPEFLVMLVRKMRDADSKEELKAAFRYFDRDGNGFISAAELREVMVSIGMDLSAREMDDIIAEADRDGDGEIDLDEFTRYMLQQSGSKAEGKGVSFGV